MRRLHIVGRRNHGKTSLIVELIQEFTRRDLRVGTIKHTHHRHEFDTPGKDSHQHRTAGACRVGLVSSSMCAAFWPSASRKNGDRYDVFIPLFAECDLVLVEGDSQTAASKIEVWRKSLGAPPIAAQDPRILAVVTDDGVDVGASVLRRSDIRLLADWIIQLLGIPTSPSGLSSPAHAAI